MLSTSSTTKNRLSVVEFDSLLSNTQTKRLSLGGPDLASASELEGSTDHSSSEPTESNEDLSAFQEAESAQELPSAPKDQKGQHQRSGAARKSEEGTRTRLLNTSRNWSPQRKDSRDKDPSQPRESLASSSSLKRDSFVLVDNTSSALNSPTYPNFAPPLSDDMEPDTSAGTITSSSAAAAPNPSRTSQDSSWGRTMRKTSGFFKKRFGNFSHQPASSPSNAPFYTNSNKSSPSQNSTATFRNQHHPSQTADIPPVPSIPQRLVTDPLDRRRSASVSRVPPSTSTNSVVQSGSNNRSRSTTSHSNTTASHSEDERLKNVLRSVDWDGLAEKLDEPPTPPSKDEPNSRQMMPPRTHNERSYSLPHSPSHFDAMAAASAAVSQQALGRPRSATVQSSPTRSSFAEDTPLRAAGREDDTTPPSIRLVPSRSTPGSPATKDNSLVYHASQPVPGKNEEEEDKMEEIEKEGTPTPPVSTTSRGDEHGLGLSLDPISESSTSRESLISNSTTRPPVSTTSLPDSPSDSISPTSIRASSMKRHSLVTSSPISISTTSLHRNFSIPASSNLSEEEIQQKGIELAQKCWDQDESAIKKHKIAEYLGSRCETLSSHEQLFRADKFVTVIPSQMSLDDTTSTNLTFQAYGWTMLSESCARSCI